MEKSKLGSLPEVTGFGALHLLAQALARDFKWLGASLVAGRLEIVIDHKRFQLSRSFYDKAWAGLLRRLGFSSKTQVEFLHLSLSPYPSSLAIALYIRIGGPSVENALLIGALLRTPFSELGCIAEIKEITK
jgi:hypothetical protein